MTFDGYIFMILWVYIVFADFSFRMYMPLSQVERSMVL